jgi:serine/threonine protein kinase/tetratricopeptide (TPR) repeat protein
MSERRVISGRFEMGELVGQGGMGSVYSGIDTQTGESVAIKALKSDIVAQDPGMVARFAREGEALRKLNHPSIVKVLAAFEDNGEHFIIMEYVSGGSLRDYLDEHSTLSIDRLLQIALDLADALTRAHRLKIIHRDIKPANVLLAEDGTPRLTDFGVARMDDSSRMTTTGAMVGTLAYLSPEACYGLEIDARSDIWAFGVMLFEMLTGRRPFEADNTAALLTAVISKPHPDIAQLRPDAPPLLVALINKMLVKDRDQRIPSVRLVGAELEAILAGASTSTLDSEWTPSANPVEAGESRFSTPTPSEQPPVVSASSKTGAKVLAPKPETAHHKVAEVMTDETGQEYVVIKRRTTIIGRLIAISVLATLVIAILLLSARPASAPEDGSTANSQILSVAPVEPGQYMVLVAQIEHVGGEERDVQRFIVDDLSRNLTDDVPFSLIRIRAYPGIIKSDEEALAAAEANHADVVIWGNYDANGLQLEAQVGSLADYPNLPFARTDVEKFANVQVRLTDERRQSLSLTVIAVLNGVHSFTGNVFEVGRNVAVMEAISVTSPEIVGNSIGARYHRFIANYISDTPASIAEMSAAIDLEARNPMLFLARSLAYQRIEDLEFSRQDIRTAQDLGPDTWVSPLWMLMNDAFYFQNDYEAALTYADQLVALQPDDWFLWFLRGGTHYLQGEYDLARADFEKSITLDPQANFPYLLLISIDIREGRFLEGQRLYKTVQEQFPDPGFATRLLNATLGPRASTNVVAQSASAFGNMTLKQWTRVIENVDAAISGGQMLSELYFLQGFAYCNLKDYAAAEAAYTKGIEADPEFVVLYGLRAEVRQKQGNLSGALADGAVLLQSDLAEVFTPLIPAITSGQLGCENLFDVDLQTLLGEATAEATVTP